LQGWKDETKRVKLAPDEGTGFNLSLVNEKIQVPALLQSNPEIHDDPNGVTVDPPQSPLEHQLEVAKGMLGKLISPARAAWIKEGGRSEEFPPIMLTKSFVEQIEALLGGDVEKYIHRDACPVCFNNAWLIEDGVRKCVVCDSRKGTLKHVYQKQQLRTIIEELVSGREEEAEKRLRKLIGA
jgi:hypothetical protein